ncbi:WD40 repeat domain-containing protein [Stieleria varia]|uniref:WD domain, G-beta repeat n=1 Tax=Stieleria varia TaxID=2528005 RepID=A0A5C5ZXQ5_9BACT|nr:hypothetical protein [Stieleria varia]TWT91771.1 WD domain, G-beta repeat [Stieleria varia]
MLRNYLACLLVIAVASSSVSADQNEPATGSTETWVTSIAPMGDSGRFVASTANGLLLRESDVVSFDPAHPGELTKLYQHPAAVWCVQATADGKRIASVDYRGNLGVYDVEAGKSSVHEKAFERWCQSMLISPDNQSVVAGNEAGKVLVWSLGENKVTQSIELEGHSVTGLAFSPDGKTLATTDGGGHVHLLSWPDLKETAKIQISESPAWCIAFVDGGAKLLVGCSDRHLYQCDAKADAKPESVAEGKDWITQLAVSSDGQVAAGEVSGALHFPSAGTVDSMNAESGVWALCWNGSSQLLAGTRKHGIVSASRSWKWSPNAPAAPAEATPTEDKPAEDKPAEATPAEDKPAEATPAEDKPAEDKPAESKEPEKAVQ